LETKPKRAPTGAAWSILQKALRGASAKSATSSRLSVSEVPQERQNMKNLMKIAGALFISLLLWCAPASAQTLPPFPVDPFLDSWSFYDATGWASDLGYLPIGFTNIVNDDSCWASDDGVLDCNGLLVDSSDPAFLNYKTVESDGHTNLICSAGIIWFWFSPDFDSESQGGTGPGDWGRFVDVGAWTSNAVFGWWSLLMSPDGNNIYFSGQTNGVGTNYLTCPISWTAGSWHLVGLTYSATNSVLYLDGEVATNGLGVIYPPNHGVLTNGFWIGSDSYSGTQQARGEFVDFEAWSDQFFHNYSTNFFSDYYNAMLPELPGSFGGGFAMDSGFGGFSGDTPSSGSNSGVPAYVDGTNLWLQITGTTNTTNGLTAYFVIWTPTNVTDGVYDLFLTTNLAANVPGLNVTNWAWVMRNTAGQTNLTVTNLTADYCFFRLADTNDTDGDGMSDAFEKLVSHTDPNNADQNTNSIPDGWEWNYFGNLNQTADGDYDGDGVDNYWEYLDGTDPNKISFTIEVADNYVSTSPASLSVNILGGVPSYYAVLVDGATSTNWTAYTSSNLTANLGSLAGWHDIWIGLRGLPSDAQQTWEWKRLNLESTSSPLVITSPTNSTVTQPMIQLAGYSAKALGSISYDLTNALGMVTNQQVLILDQYYDTNTFAFTTNTFQAFDIPLTNGVNTITIHASDLAGNAITTNISYTLSYAGKTNPPTFALNWPTSGAQISGNQFTIVGQLADYTATVTATLTDTNGVTNSYNGVVERDGTFWLDNVQLSGVTNVVTLTFFDPAGNVSVTNITVYQSGVVLTMDAPDAASLWQPTIDASGTISSDDIDTSDYTVWVNGVQVTNDGYGDWYGTVPVNPGGVADFNLTAYPPGENPSGGGGSGGSGSGGGWQNPPDTNAVSEEINLDKPVRVYAASDTQVLDSYSHNQTITVETDGDADDGDEYNYDDQVWQHYNHQWQDGVGGQGSSSNLELTVDGDGTLGTNLTSAVMTWQTNGSGTEIDTANDGTLSTNTIGLPTIGNEHCEVNDPTNPPATFYYPDDDDISTNQINQTYKRMAQTEMKLATGGRAVPGHKSLIQISGSATEILDKRWVPGQTLDAGNSTNIPPETLTVGTLGNLDTNGNLYVMLPDGDPVVTPKVKWKDHYIFTVSGRSYPLAIMANDVQLVPKFARNEANYCVGEGLYFNVVGLSEDVYESVAKWTLPGTPGTFVNRQPDPNCLAFFDEDTNLLTRSSVTNGALTSPCWYVEGLTNATVGVNVSYRFYKTGIWFTETITGKFNVQRPTTQFFKYDDGTPTVSTNNGMLVLGTPGTNDMSFKHQIILTDGFTGTAGYTQVIDGSGNGDIGYISSSLADNGSWKPIYDIELDNYEFQSGQHSISSSGQEISFRDAPGEGLPVQNTTHEKLAFSTYLLFKPDLRSGDPGPNIFVPLRVVNWTLDDEAQKDSSGNWSVTSGNPVPAPTDNVPTDFPHWLETFNNTLGFGF
jgi:hypothetical protein